MEDILPRPSLPEGSTTSATLAYTPLRLGAENQSPSLHEGGVGTLSCRKMGRGLEFRAKAGTLRRMGNGEDGGSAWPAWQEGTGRDTGRAGHPTPWTGGGNTAGNCQP